MWKIILISTAAFMLAVFLFLENYKAPLPENHGKVRAQLSIGEGENQPLIVGFGGGEGGNAWASDYWKEPRQQFIDQGYAFLAVGYFGMKGTPESLDRISLNAIYDTIMLQANHTLINKDKIALVGASKGGELALNLASRYPEVDAVVSIVSPHVSFPAITIMANTSSWSYDGEEVAFVPATYATIGPALKGDLLTAHALMLEDESAEEKAAIEVEKINGSVLLISASEDEQWPSASMSNKVIERLSKNDFEHYFKHEKIEGGHVAPLAHFDMVFDFLNQHIKNL
ncbi:alpha/beta fold hydrolase [Fulvivirga sp. RKSG066]|uniref:alpha/beta fold hydrolase n=1 Tax=Fulvivirga aurantia TaxID=2529383 RepID=UPI0012BC5AA1|nr:alpha/beta fold hydrolase [Fulvivirga aurantia]MTI20513.1 alpha/beta fold hydrolase [Fulvivirga aurantia]